MDEKIQELETKVSKGINENDKKKILNEAINFRGQIQELSNLNQQKRSVKSKNNFITGIEKDYLKRIGKIIDDLSNN